MTFLLTSLMRQLNAVCELRNKGLRLGAFLLFGLVSVPAFGQVSFWPPSAVPKTPAVLNDPSSVTLGIKFYLDVPGFVTGVRFYKGASNEGNHVGALWTSTGSELAEVTFSGETASGWQQANFSSPVSVAANTTYIVSYLAPNGSYAEDDAYPWSTLSAAPLHVVGSSPGVFAYGSKPSFPQGTWNDCNYWVDVVFTTSQAGGSGTESISGTITNGAGATVILTGTTNATTTADASGNYTFANVSSGTDIVVPNKAGFAFTPASQSVTVAHAKVTGINFKATAADSVWTSSAVPATAQATGDPAAVTLGLQFYSDVPGEVTGVRFYKGPNNIGAHVGNLWTTNGVDLATVTFTDETASGWQQASFASPVSIAANTTYVISYLAPKGNYADDQSYSWSKVSAAPLHVSGSSPGVFAYGSAAKYPNGTWNSSNYWVDLVFVPSATIFNPAPTSYSISGTVSGAAATLTLSGGSSSVTNTGIGGTYSFSGLQNGSYVIAPSQAGYSFNPATASVTVNGAIVAGVNFAAAALPAPQPHTVTLNWTASTSPNIVEYNVYRGSAHGGPYVLAGAVGAKTFTDSAVSAGQTYYYVTTAVDSSSHESGYSNETVAAVPTP